MLITDTDLIINHIFMKAESRLSWSKQIPKLSVRP